MDVQQIPRLFQTQRHAAASPRHPAERPLLAASGMALGLGLSLTLSLAVCAPPAYASFLTPIEEHVDGLGGVDGLLGAASVTLSPDGAHLYATGEDEDALAVFSRDPFTGELTWLEVHAEGVGGVSGMTAATDVTVSADGEHVYVAGAGDDAVAVFARDGVTGLLTFVEAQFDGVGANSGMLEPTSVAVAPDGGHVYVTGFSSDAVAVFSRDAGTGALTFVEEQIDGIGGVDGLAGASDVVVSPDNTHVYVAGFTDNMVAVFTRDPGTGALTFVEVQEDGTNGVDGLRRATALAFNAAGNRLYVAANVDHAVAVFTRDTTTGALTFVEAQFDGTGSVDGLRGATSVAVGQIGGHVYSTGNNEDKVAAFAASDSTGALTFLDVQQDGVGTATALRGAVDVAVSFDGAHVYVAGYLDDALQVFSAGAAQPYLTYRVKAPKKDIDGEQIPNNAFPRGWEFTTDDVLVGSSENDDPENVAVRRVTQLLLPQNDESGAGPADPDLHYLFFDARPAKQGIRPILPSGAFERAIPHAPRQWNLLNRFGTINVRSVKLVGTMVPAGMDLTAAPAAAADDNHYSCYQTGVAPDVTDQTPVPTGKVRRDMQVFVEDEFDDCAVDRSGNPPFQATAVEGKCLYTLDNPAMLCSSAATSVTEPPRATSAYGIDGSAPGRLQTLLCYKVKLGKKYRDADAAALAGAAVGDKVNPGLDKHIKRKVKTANEVFTAPGNQFPNPTVLETSAQRLLCLPSTTQDQTVLQ